MPEETLWASALVHMLQLGALMQLLMVRLLSKALHPVHSYQCTRSAHYTALE